MWTIRNKDSIAIFAVALMYFTHVRARGRMI
jgi:hypothetical protein